MKRKKFSMWYKYLTLLLSVSPLLACSPGVDVFPFLKAESGWKVTPLLQAGEQDDGSVVVGLMDGLGVFADGQNLALSVNHEVPAGLGNLYELDNGTELRGSRISRLLLNPENLELSYEDLAYHTIMDRNGIEVSKAQQVNELADDAALVNEAGLDRFCSAQLVTAGRYGFVDSIYFTGEETSVKYSHPQGGSVWALDIEEKTLWALPDLGRGSWENVTPLVTGRKNMVALLLGDDKTAAPLYLYLGLTKPNAEHFLDRNGLRGGQLYVWRADKAIFSAEQFHGTGKKITGRYIPIATRNTAAKGSKNHDAQGYLNDLSLRSWATDVLGAFAFSRPEDLHSNPANGRQVVLASTGSGDRFPSDYWGTIYLLEHDFSNLSQLKASLRILYDGDDLNHRDLGLRSPDNLTWATDGYIYVQEDRATAVKDCVAAGGNAKSCEFGGKSQRDASIWQLQPENGQVKRIAEIQQPPKGQEPWPSDAVDTKGKTLGGWESSGIVDVSEFFSGSKTRLLLTVQAHSVRGDTYAENGTLEASQLLLLESK